MHVRTTSFFSRDVNPLSKSDLKRMEQANAPATQAQLAEKPKQATPEAGAKKESAAKGHTESFFCGCVSIPIDEEQGSETKASLASRNR